MYGSLEATPLALVSTLSQLMEMVSVIERCTEVAIDVEHHDYRSFLGIPSFIIPQAVDRLGPCKFIQPLRQSQIQ